MRPVVTDNKVIYIRFRKDLDAIIEQAAIDAGIAKATLVGRVLTEYITALSTACRGNLASVSKADCNLSPLSSAFFAKKGRAVERSIGKPMRVTLKLVDERNMRMAAVSAGYSITQFRTAILVSWAVRENKL